jgi:hypothetical protein
VSLLFDIFLVQRLVRRYLTLEHELLILPRTQILYSANVLQFEAKRSQYTTSSESRVQSLCRIHLELTLALSMFFSLSPCGFNPTSPRPPHLLVANNALNFPKHFPYYSRALWSPGRRVPGNCRAAPNHFSCSRRRANPLRRAHYQVLGLIRTSSYACFATVGIVKSTISFLRLDLLDVIAQVFSSSKTAIQQSSGDLKILTVFSGMLDMRRSGSRSSYPRVKRSCLAGTGGPQL